MALGPMCERIFMNEHLAVLLAEFNRTTGGRLEVVRRFFEGSLVVPPADYFDFMADFDGGAGVIGEGYAELWSAEQLVQLNDGYAVDEFAPGIVLIGSDGGDSAYGFARIDGVTKIVTVPLLGMCWDEVEVVSESFEGFLRAVAGA